MEVGDGVESGTAAPAPLLRRPYVLIVVVERMGVAAAGRAEFRMEVRVPRPVHKSKFTARSRRIVRAGQHWLVYAQTADA